MRRPAFSLIELLVVIAILGVLAGIVLPVSRTLSKSAAATTERAAARSLVSGWRSWSFDHRGALLPGQLQNGVPLSGAESPIAFNGTPIPDIARRRWIWRLAPYLDNVVATLWVNDQSAFWEHTIANATDQETSVYLTTLHPSFGMNTDFIGGRQSNASDTWTMTQFIQSQDDAAPALYSETIAQLRRPADLIGFASSRGPLQMENQSRTIEGYWRLTSPWKPAATGSVQRWTVSEHGTFLRPEEGTDPESVGGFLSPRHGNRAVVAAPDGHVSLKTFDAVCDMRAWADAAHSANWAPSIPE